MKQKKIYIPTIGSIYQYDNISRMVEEFNQLGIYNNVHCYVEYDENDLELDAKVHEIFAKHNYTWR